MSQEPAPPPADHPTGHPPARPGRPFVERVGLLLIAVVLAALFGTVGVAAWVNGESFLGAMGLIGAVMTLWAGGQTLRPG